MCCCCFTGRFLNICMSPACSAGKERCQACTGTSSNSTANTWFGTAAAASGSTWLTGWHALLFIPALQLPLPPRLHCGAAIPGRSPYEEEIQGLKFRATSSGAIAQLHGRSVPFKSCAAELESVNTARLLLPNADPWPVRSTARCSSQLRGMGPTQPTHVDVTLAWTPGCRHCRDR